MHLIENEVRKKSCPIEKEKAFWQEWQRKTEWKIIAALHK
jgi:hypothetical protein